MGYPLRNRFEAWFDNFFQLNETYDKHLVVFGTWRIFQLKWHGTEILKGKEMKEKKWQLPKVGDENRSLFFKHELPLFQSFSWQKWWDNHNCRGRLTGYGATEISVELLPRATILGVGMEGAMEGGWMPKGGRIWKLPTNIWGFPKIGFFPPKSSIFIGFSLINHPFWDTPIFGNTQIYREMIDFDFN